MEESNLMASNATGSSLWEIKTLQSHILPEIAHTAKFIDREVPKTEWDISQELERTIEDVTIQIWNSCHRRETNNLILLCVYQ